MTTSTILSDNGVTSGTSGLKTSGGNDGTLILQTTTSGGTATTALTIDTGQRTKFPTTIGVGDATPSTSGSGISFPATQSASTDANTLDDYEEGTWTPTAIGTTSAGTGTYTNQTGYYTKVGNTVTIWMDLGWSNHTGTGNLRFASLPFTINSSVYCCGVFGFVKNLTLTASNLLTGYGDAGTSEVSLAQYAVGGSDVSAVAMDTSCRLMYTMTYRV